VAGLRPVPRIFGFTWFRITSSRVLHNLVILVIKVRNFESHVEFSGRCASVKISNSTKYSVLQALKFQEVSVSRILSGGTGIADLIRTL
jgi:hypothetical protein